MRKRRFLTQKAAFCKEENAALFSAYQRQPLFLRVLRERFSQDMYPKRRFWVHIAIDMYPKRRFWIHIAADMYPKRRFWVHIAGVLWF